MLKIKIEKDTVTDSNSPREISIHIEENQIVLEPHLVVVFGGSDIRVTARRDGKAILVLEEEVLGDTISSLGQQYRIGTRIDVSNLPRGKYAIAVQRKLWKAIKGEWVTEEVFKDSIAIG